MKQITFKDLKDGDNLLQRNKFNRKDINTWMSPLVYFGLNFWNWVLNKPLIPCNHVGKLYLVDGEWIVNEAKLKVVNTPLKNKIMNTDITYLYIKRYKKLTNKQRTLMKNKAFELLGTKYDFISILKQYVRKLSNDTIDLETNPRKFKNQKVNCSENLAIQDEAAEIYWKNTKSVSPSEIHLDTRSYDVGYLKKTY